MQVVRARRYGARMLARQRARRPASAEQLSRQL
jgi:hypothetical protein